MKLSGGRQRMWIGAWILAALFLGGLNGFWLMSLEQQPLVGYSQTIRNLQRQLVQFESIQIANVWSSDPGSNMRVISRPSAEPDDPEPPAGAGTQSRTAESLGLPALSGIMQVMDHHGSVLFQAVLNGRVCRQKDKIDVFTVDQITSEGVVLRHSGSRWFIKSPSPFYSSDLGD